MKFNFVHVYNMYFQGSIRMERRCSNTMIKSPEIYSNEFNYWYNTLREYLECGLQYWKFPIEDELWSILLRIPGFPPGMPYGFKTPGTFLSEFLFSVTKNSPPPPPAPPPPPPPHAPAQPSEHSPQWSWCNNKYSNNCCVNYGLQPPTHLM